MYQMIDPPAIPDLLRSLPRWVRWDRVEVRGGRATKRPHGSTRTGPWYSLEDAVAQMPPGLDGGQAGVGLVTTGPVDIGGGRSLFALDLDGCRNPDTGVLSLWAQDLVASFNSYTEITPSGSGLRIFGFVNGAVPQLRVVHVPEPVAGGDHLRCEIQVFGAGPAGYVTVTGDVLPGTEGHTIRECGAAFEGLRKTYPQATLVPESDYDARPVGRVPTVEELDRAVRRAASDADRTLIDSGDWQSAGLPSASEGWFLLTQAALACCADHVDVAVRWLLDCTSYGRGEVEESKDPGRYSSESWVRADLLRVAGKRRAAVTSVFDPVPTNGVGPLAEGQRSPFDIVSVDAPFTAEAPAAAEEPAEDGNYFEDAWRLVARDTRPKWLVRGLLEQDCLAVVSGAPASFKSFLIFDMALALSLGRPWHGRKVAAGPVMIVVGEGRGGLSRRLTAWANENDADLRDAKLALTRHAAQINDDEGFVFVVEQAKAKAIEWGEAPRMIVIDTLNRNFGPGDENSTSDVTKFWLQCDRLKRVFPGCTVVVVHHVGHSNTNRSRGSSVIGGTVDAEIVLTRDRDKKTDAPRPGARVVVRKTKDAEEPAPFWISTKFVHLGTDDEGEPYGSLVIDRVCENEPAASGNPLSDPEVQDEITVVLGVYQRDPAASLRNARETAGLAQRRFDSARKLAIEWGLLEKVGATSDARHIVTANGVERLEGAKDVPAPTDPDIAALLGGGDE